MFRLLTLLFAGWVVSRVMAENAAPDRRGELLPSPGGRKQPARRARAGG